MSKARDATKMFAEPLARHAHPYSEPEKYNLYKDLMLLAEATDEVQRDIQALTHAVRNK